MTKYSIVPVVMAVSEDTDHADMTSKMNTNTRLENGGVEKVSSKSIIFPTPLITTVATILLIVSHVQN